MGDYDNDGALDVIIGVNGGPPVLLKNNAAKGNNWLGLKLEGVTCNRDAIGARIIWKAGGKTENATEEQRRKLSFIARSSRNPGYRRSAADR